MGNATAMYNLAIFYVHGWGGLKCDREKAEDLMRKAAELGESNAKAVCENRTKNSEPLVTQQFDTYKNKRTKEVQNVVEVVMKSTLDIYQIPYSKFYENNSDNSPCSSSTSRSSVLLSEFDHSDSSANYYSGTFFNFHSSSLQTFHILFLLYLMLLFTVGICYEHGIGVKQNLDNAVRHYSSAAFSGSSEALYNLAACYETTAGSNQSGIIHALFDEM